VVPRENFKVAYNLVDLKPTVAEELNEVIKHVEYHPYRSDLFLFSSSKGYLSTCYLSISSQSDSCTTKFILE
jgi:hypothetical protein